jgi:hypothetical protein
MLDFDELGDKDLGAVDPEDDDDYILKTPVKFHADAKKAPKATGKENEKPPPEPIGRRIQVLVLHGRQSNTNLVNFQIGALKRAMGKEVDIKILEAPLVWKYRDGVDNHDADPMTISLSKGLDFKTWFNHTTDDKRDRVDFFKQLDTNVKVTYNSNEVDKAVNMLLDFIANDGPIDVIVTIFEGSLVVHLAIAKLLKEGKPIPWRFSIMFCPLSVRDDALAEPLIKKKVDHPALMIFGKIDEYHYYQRTAAGRTPSEEYYDTTVMEHNEGHQLPSVAPRSTQIYDRIVEEMQYHCGMSSEVPKKLKIPPKPTSMVLKVLEDMSLRKLRVLVFCGGHSCIPVIKFQTNALKMALGKDAAEFVYIEGTKDWTWYEGEPTVSDMEERIANGKQLKNWYYDRCHEPGGEEKEILGLKATIKTDRLNKDKNFDPETFVEYFDIPELVEYWIDYIYKEGPFDVLLGFSQGCILMHLIIAYMRKKKVGGREVYPERWKHTRSTQDDMPWRLSVFFNGMHVRDKRYFDLFEKPLPNHPTVFVYGKADEYYEYSKDGFGNKNQEEYYEKVISLTHEQNHEFPTQQPRAKQIYDKVVAEIWRTCGGKPLS